MLNTARDGGCDIHPFQRILCGTNKVFPVSGSGGVHEERKCEI